MGVRRGRLAAPVERTRTPALVVVMCRDEGGIHHGSCLDVPPPRTPPAAPRPPPPLLPPLAPLTDFFFCVGAVLGRCCDLPCAIIGADSSALIPATACTLSLRALMVVRLTPNAPPLTPAFLVASAAAAAAPPPRGGGGVAAALDDKAPQRRRLRQRRAHMHLGHGPAGWKQPLWIRGWW